MLFVSCLRKGFVSALAMMKQCSKAMGVMLSVMAFPLVTFLLVTLSLSFCTVTSINLATSGLPVYYKVGLNSSNPECGAITGNQPCVPETFKASDYPNCPVRCVFAEYDEEDGFFQRNTKYFQIYNFLACFWCLHVIITLSQCTLARTFSAYYWSLSKPQTSARSTLSKALFQTLRYHTGSLAFGAVFVTMFQGVRIVLEYLKNITKKYWWRTELQTVAAVLWKIPGGWSNRSCKEEPVFANAADSERILTPSVGSVLPLTVAAAEKNVQELKRH
ncbi:hypothetical protein QTP70_004540 [Hemibagrus guttatus]|uniref:Choline transporter-like protein n=1 Tax=Hemibagrus guttatus TaxID=175788 RepID=A0AAE0UI53_9TELE|nr:hypothetical protein QTP70_004540 [Hemibagrus guttatus]